MMKKVTLVALVVGISLFWALRGSAQAPTKLDPPGPPAPTMKTLDEIPPTWSQILPADDTGDPCNSMRFKCVFPSTSDPDGAAVLDKETGLVWARRPQFGRKWEFVYRACVFHQTGDRFGYRLPTVEELASLQGAVRQLPPGHPFLDIEVGQYWSASEDPVDPSQAFIVALNELVGTIAAPKTLELPALCVRGPGNRH